mgnify:CR=1 FL=1
MKPGNQPRLCGPVPTPAGHHLAWQMRATHASFPGAGTEGFFVPEPARRIQGGNDEPHG